MGALAHRIGHHAVQPHGRQQQRNAAEDAQQTGGDLLGEDGGADVVFIGHAVVDADRGIDALERAAQQRHGEFDFARAAQEQADAAVVLADRAIALLQWQVYDGPGHLDEPGGLTVLDEPDDDRGLRASANRHAERIAARHVMPRELLVDYGYEGVVAVVGSGELPSGEERSLHHPEIAGGDQIPIASGRLAGRAEVATDLDSAARRALKAQGNRFGVADTGHARHRLEPFFDLGDEVRALLERSVAAGRKVQLGDQHVVRIEARIEGRRGAEALGEQAGAGDRHHRQCHLGGHQKIAHAVRPRAGAAAAAALFQVIDQVRPRGMQRRHEAGDERRRHAQQNGEGEDVPVEWGVQPQRHIDGRDQQAQRLPGPPGQRQRHGGTDGGE